MTFATIKGAEMFARLRKGKLQSRVSHGMMIALMFMAAGFVSLRPICELAFGKYSGLHAAALSTATGHATTAQPGSVGTQSAICCASVTDGTLVKPAEPVASWARGGTQGAVLFFFAGLTLLSQSRYPASGFFADLPKRSFYTRSARILR